MSMLIPTIALAVLIGLVIISLIIAVYVLFYKQYGPCKDSTTSVFPFWVNPQKEDFEMIRAGSGVSYKVHEDLANPKLAAETMDKLNNDAHKLIDHMMAKYVNGAGLSEIKESFKQEVVDVTLRMKQRFKTASMVENVPSRSGGDTSFVINKGDTFAVCLRDPNNGNLVDDNMNENRFVLFHEMSHLGDKNYGHERSFWETFRFVLQEAVLIGLHEAVDYRYSKMPYCGIKISYSPLFDSDLTDWRFNS